jgi:hypothetical protein
MNPRRSANFYETLNESVIKILVSTCISPETFCFYFTEMILNQIALRSDYGMIFCFKQFSFIFELKKNLFFQTMMSASNIGWNCF